jgi:hypothetical protein
MATFPVPPRTAVSIQNDSGLPQGPAVGSVPIWTTSLSNDAGELAQPDIYNGIMYVVERQLDFCARCRHRPTDLAHAC